SSYLIKELDAKRKFVAANVPVENDSVARIIEKDLHIIRRTLADEPYYRKGLDGLDLNSSWTAKDFTPALNQQLEAYFAGYEEFYQMAFNKATAFREKKMYDDENREADPIDLNAYKNAYFNESLADLVKNIKVKERIIEHNGELIQQINPVYVDPRPSGVLDYRAHFFAPTKNFFGTLIDTFVFNLIVIWGMTLVLYGTLYFELLRKGVESLTRFGMSVKNKAGG